MCTSFFDSSLARLNQELADIDSGERGGEIIDREIAALQQREEEEEEKRREMRQKGEH